MKLELCLIVALATIAVVKADECGPTFDTADFGVNVNFTIWVEAGSNPAGFAASVQLKVPTGATYYQMMLIAQIVNPVFKFDSKFFAGLGHYITAINGIYEDVPNKIFWMLYLLNSPPNPLAPPNNSFLTPKGVDGMICHEGDQILFWRHHFTSTH